MLNLLEMISYDLFGPIIFSEIFVFLNMHVQITPELLLQAAILVYLSSKVLKKRQPLFGDFLRNGKSLPTQGNKN